MNNHAPNDTTPFEEKAKRRRETIDEMHAKYQQTSRRIFAEILALLILAIVVVTIKNHLDWIADVEACMRFQSMYTRAQCEDYLRILRN